MVAYCIDFEDMVQLGNHVFLSDASMCGHLFWFEHIYKQEHLTLSIIC